VEPSGHPRPLDLVWAAGGCPERPVSGNVAARASALCRVTAARGKADRPCRASNGGTVLCSHAVCSSDNRRRLCRPNGLIKLDRDNDYTAHRAAPSRPVVSGLGTTELRMS
jgi:hypothetical protein